MTRRRASSEPSPTLPPVELRRSRFVHPSQTLETPLTNAGLVDTRRLIKLVHSTLNSAYKWPSGSINKHHLYWPNTYYPDISATEFKLEEGEEAPNPHVFRNKVYNQIDAPDSFHAWLHEVTKPPVEPTLQTIRFANWSQGGVNEMAEAVRIGMQLMRDKDISSVRLDARMAELFKQFQTGMEMIGSLPEEFRLIDLDDFKVTDAIDMLNVRSSIGHLAVRPTVAMTTRIIKQNTIAELRDDDFDEEAA